MNKNTTCLALAGKCGGRGAIMLAPVAASAGGAKKPSRESRSIRARPANPPPTCHRNSRRERRHGVGLGMKRCMMTASVRIHEFVQVENDAAHLFERFLLQKLLHGGLFRRRGRARQCEPVSTLNL